jgi:hypothetical protein
MTQAEDVIRTIAKVISPMTYLLNKKLTNLDAKEKASKNTASKNSSNKRTAKKGKKDKKK